MGSISGENSAMTLIRVKHAFKSICLSNQIRRSSTLQARLLSKVGSNRAQDIILKVRPLQILSSANKMHLLYKRKLL